MPWKNDQRDTTLLVLKMGYGAWNANEAGKGKEMNSSESIKKEISLIF